MLAHRFSRVGWVMLAYRTIIPENNLVVVGACADIELRSDPARPPGLQPEKLADCCRHAWYAHYRQNSHVVLEISVGVGHTLSLHSHSSHVDR